MVSGESCVTANAVTQNSPPTTHHPRFLEQMSSCVSSLAFFARVPVSWITEMRRPARGKRSDVGESGFEPEEYQITLARRPAPLSAVQARKWRGALAPSQVGSAARTGGIRTRIASSWVRAAPSSWTMGAGAATPCSVIRC